VLTVRVLQSRSKQSTGSGLKEAKVVGLGLGLFTLGECGRSLTPHGCSIVIVELGGKHRTISSFLLFAYI